MPALQFYMLDALPSQVELGMPFLWHCNPTIDWVARTVTFGVSRVLALPPREAVQVELCSVRSLLKTVHKARSIAWFCLLQPGVACLSMEASEQSQVGQEGVRTPSAPGADHPQVASLLEEFGDVFCDPEFPLDSCMTHAIDLFDPDA